jgi:hypothetical protein
MEKRILESVLLKALGDLLLFTQMKLYNVGILESKSRAKEMKR